MRGRTLIPSRPRCAALPVTLIVMALAVAACATPDASEPSSAASASPSLAAEPSVEPSEPPTPTPVPTPPKPEPPVIAIIPTGAGPNVTAASEDAVWVELHREDLVARIDPETNMQVAVTEVPVHCEVATTSTDGWATIARESLLSRYDLDTGELVDQLSIPDACGLATSSDGQVWVTSPGSGEIYEIRPGEEEPVRAIPVAPLIFGLAVMSDAVWVSGEESGGTAYRVDTDAGEVTASVPLEGVDTIVVLGDALWASSRFGNRVWKLDASTGDLLGEVEVQGASGVVESGASVWATTLSGNLVEIDPEAVEIRSTQALGYTNLSFPITAFGDLWVAALENDVVLRVDLPD